MNTLKGKNYQIISDNVIFFNSNFFILPHFYSPSWIQPPQLLDRVELYKDVPLNNKAPLILITDPVVLFLGGHAGQVVKFQEIRIGDPPFPYTTYRYISPPITAFQEESSWSSRTSFFHIIKWHLIISMNIVSFYKTVCKEMLRYMFQQKMTMSYHLSNKSKSYKIYIFLMKYSIN